MNSDEQQKPQGKKKLMVSPRSGAAIEVPNKYTWKKGQSGNPSGGSLKVRIRKALDDLPPDQIQNVVANIASLAESSGDPVAVSAFQALCRAAGVFEDSSAPKKVEVVTLIRFEERPGEDGPVVPQRVRPAAPPRLLGPTEPGTSIGVHVT